MHGLTSPQQWQAYRQERHNAAQLVLEQVMLGVIHKQAGGQLRTALVQGLSAGLQNFCESGQDGNDALQMSCCTPASMSDKLVSAVLLTTGSARWLLLWQGPCCCTIWGVCGRA